MQRVCSSLECRQGTGGCTLAAYKIFVCSGGPLFIQSNENGTPPLICFFRIGTLKISCMFCMQGVWAL